VRVVAAVVSGTSKANPAAKRRRTIANPGGASPLPDSDKRSVCKQYAQHGNCPYGNRCKDSHDMLRVLKEADPMGDTAPPITEDVFLAVSPRPQLAPAAAISTTKADSAAAAPTAVTKTTSSLEVVEGAGALSSPLEPGSEKKSMLHSAGYDARCTGMVAGFLALAKGNTASLTGNGDSGLTGVSHSRGGGRGGRGGGRASSGRGAATSSRGGAATASGKKSTVERGGLQTRWRHSQGQQLYLTGKQFPLKLVQTQWG
jgi:hypothetical protein